MSTKQLSTTFTICTNIFLIDCWYRLSINFIIEIDQLGNIIEKYKEVKILMTESVYVIELIRMPICQTFLGSS